MNIIKGIKLIGKLALGSSEQQAKGGDGAGKIQDLKKISIFKSFSDEQLKDISAAIAQRTLKEGEIVFEEGVTGNSLFWVLKGQVGIEKKLDLEGKEFKQLALLSEGDIFGEMSLFEPEVRSARAVARTDAVLVELENRNFRELIEKQPEFANRFFIEMMGTLSRRLRRTSSELAMLFDLSNMILEKHQSQKAFLENVVKDAVIHLDGSWTIGGYYYNIFNDETEFVTATGCSKETLPEPVTVTPELQSEWLSDTMYRIIMPGKTKPLGYLVFASCNQLSTQEKNNLAITFKTVAHFTSAMMENIEHDMEQVLKQRLENWKMKY